MSDEIRMEGLGVAPGVLDTIVTLAAEGVEGVASVGAAGIAGLVQKGPLKRGGRAVEVTSDEDGSVSVSVHVHVAYGSKLREVAAEVQRMVEDSLTSQVGVSVSSVDVYVDGLVFPE